MFWPIFEKHLSFSKKVAFKSIVENDRRLFFDFRVASNLWNIRENDILEIRFKNIASYKCVCCRIDLHSIKILTFTFIWMFRFSGNDGARLEHGTSGGYSNKWTDVRSTFNVLYRKLSFMVLETMTLTLFIRFDVEPPKPVSSKLRISSGGMCP